MGAIDLFNDLAAATPNENFITGIMENLRHG
jgi:hypothetical protein